jgi:hypothetical protein
VVGVRCFVSDHRGSNKRVVLSCGHFVWSCGLIFLYICHQVLRHLW